MAKLNLDNLLKQYGLTQKDLANYTGINKNTVSKYCNNTFESVNKEHIDLLCKFFDCLPNDLFEIDSSVEVKVPSIVLYNEITDEFEIYTNTLKEYKQLVEKQNSEKNESKHINNSNKYDIIDNNFKINDDNSSYNIKIPDIREQVEFINSLLEKQVEKEVEKQFEEKYSDFLSEYIKNYISEYFVSKFSEQKNTDNGMTKPLTKELYKKSMDSKISYNSIKKSLNTKNQSYIKDWTDLWNNSITDNDSSNNNEVESCIKKKKDYTNKD
jgi:putative transcriptional regulator